MNILSIRKTCFILLIAAMFFNTSRCESTGVNTDVRSTGNRAVKLPWELHDIDFTSIDTFPEEVSTSCIYDQLARDREERYWMGEIYGIYIVDYITMILLLALCIILLNTILFTTCRLPLWKDLDIIVITGGGERTGFGGCLTLTYIAIFCTSTILFSGLVINKYGRFNFFCLGSENQPTDLPVNIEAELIIPTIGDSKNLCESLIYTVSFSEGVRKSTQEQSIDETKYPPQECTLLSGTSGDSGVLDGQLYSVKFHFLNLESFESTQQSKINIKLQSEYIDTNSKAKLKYRILNKFDRDEINESTTSISFKINHDDRHEYLSQGVEFPTSEPVSAKIMMLTSRYQNLIKDFAYTSYKPFLESFVKSGVKTDESRLDIELGITIDKGHYRYEVLQVAVTPLELVIVLISILVFGFIIVDRLKQSRTHEAVDDDSIKDEEN